MQDTILCLRNNELHIHLAQEGILMPVVNIFLIGLRGLLLEGTLIFISIEKSPSSSVSHSFIDKMKKFTLN